jgi:hypothetical protein
MSLQSSIVQVNPAARTTKPPQSWLLLEGLVYAIVILLIVVRFFTERVAILPRALNAIDLIAVPILLPFCLLWTIVKKKFRFRGKWPILLITLFLIVWSFSWLVNSAEVHWIGGLLFVGGLLTPICFYLILINIGLYRRFCRRLLRLLSALLIVNLIIGSIQARQGFGTGADFVFGTFGVNQNQLAFFLAVMMAYLLARWRYQRFSIFNLLLLLWSSILFILCGFQTLWIMFAVACGLVFLVFGLLTGRLLAGKISRKLIPIVVITALVPVFALSLLNFTRFNIYDVLSQFSTHFDRLGKVQLIKSVPLVWESRPWAFWLGVGPGTFNSRAFRSIAIVPYGTGGGTDVAASVIEPFYTSELSARFVIPYFQRGVYLLSGANTDGPFTSYVSVPIEVGMIGGVALFGIYGIAALALIRSLRHSSDPQQRMLAAWALSCLLMLLGIAAVDNYLETTRYTLLVWLTVAVWQIYAQGGGSVRLP